MKAGDTQRFYCPGGCSAEFEITFEPKLSNATDREKKHSGIDDKTPAHCPFCGKEGIEEC
jgi:hypothetical protein